MVHADRSRGGGAGDKSASDPMMQHNVTVQKVRSGVTGEDAAEAALVGVLDAICPEDSAGGDEPEAAALRLVGEVSRVAMLMGFKGAAERGAKFISKCKDAPLAAVVLADCTNTELAVMNLGPEAEKYTKKMVDTRLNALERLDKCLISAVRAEDPEVVHEVCALAWNLSLPALQPNIRKQAKRVLQSCSKALEDIFSPLHELRAQLHLEVARCDVADDLYAAASQQVKLQKSRDQEPVKSSRSEII